MWRRAARFWGLIPLALIIGLLGVRAAITVDPRDVLAPDPLVAADPPDSTAGSGSIFVARGGPLIIGFQSDGESRLVIGNMTIHGHGVVTQRLILPAGPLSIRFAGPPDARLVWSPPGRRGDPEYLPASSVSPLPAIEAQFGDGVGTARADGAIALAILVVVVGTLLALARRRLRAVPRAMWLAIALVFVGGVALRWFDLGGAGQTWDEDVYWASGRNDVTNLLALDTRPASWNWNFEHPPITKYLDGIGAQFSDGFGPARALSALWIALGCALLVPIGARLFRLRVGVLAAVIATLLPPLIAHGKIVGHESPAVLWWTLGILLALGVHDDAPDMPDRAARRRLLVRLAWCGVVVGIAIASRFVNALLGPLVGAIVLIQAPPAWRRATLAWGAAVIPIVAMGTLFAVWPRLWHAPFAHIAESWAKLKGTHSPEPFLGMITATPGPHYFLVYLAATTPLGVLLGVVAWGWRTISDRASRRSALVLAAWFVVPLGVMASPVRQDGVRYVMPCVVVLAMMAAAGFDALATRLAARVRRAFPILAGAVVAYLAIVDARIHPYYLDYFGEQVGGAGTVDRHQWFETAWWGEGVDRAVAYVNAHAAPDAVVYRNCIEPTHLAWFRGDLWTPMTNNPAAATWIVTYAPLTHPCPMPPGVHRVFTVDAADAPLAEVWQKD